MVIFDQNRVGLAGLTVGLGLGLGLGLGMEQGRSACYPDIPWELENCGINGQQSCWRGIIQGGCV